MMKLIDYLSSGSAQAFQGRRLEAEVHGDHLDGLLEEQRGVCPGMSSMSLIPHCMYTVWHLVSRDILYQRNVPPAVGLVH